MRSDPRTAASKDAISSGGMMRLGDLRVGVDEAVVWGGLEVSSRFGGRRALVRLVVVVRGRREGGSMEDWRGLEEGVEVDCQ